MRRLRGVGWQMWRLPIIPPVRGFDNIVHRRTSHIPQHLKQRIERLHVVPALVKLRQPGAALRQLLLKQLAVQGAALQALAER